MSLADVRKQVAGKSGVFSDELGTGHKRNDHLAGRAGRRAVSFRYAESCRGYVGCWEMARAGLIKGMRPV